MASLLGFIVRRILASIVVCWAIITIVFFLAHSSPYDPVREALGRFYFDQHIVKQMKHVYGLDLPLWQQYFRYLNMLIHGNLGYSSEVARMGYPVWSIIQGGVPVTMKLGVWALVLSLVIGLPAGLYSALHQNSLLDHALQGTLIFLYIVPVFVLVPFAQLFFGSTLHLLPVTGWGDSGWFGPFGYFPNPGASVQEMILPVTIFAAGIAGFFAKSFRSFLLEILRQDYIRTARAKGLKHRVVIYLHACKNTLLPLASIVGPTIAFLILGAFIIEYYFSIPGIGTIAAASILTSDYAVITGTTLLLVVAVIIVNMLTDIFYAMVDPRVRLE